MIQEKILALIQTWADAFGEKPDLEAIGQVYQSLKNQGTGTNVNIMSLVIRHVYNIYHFIYPKYHTTPYTTCTLSNCSCVFNLQAYNFQLRILIHFHQSSRRNE